MCSCEQCGELDCSKPQKAACVTYTDCRLHSDGFDNVNDDFMEDENNEGRP